MLRTIARRLTAFLPEPLQQNLHDWRRRRAAAELAATLQTLGLQANPDINDLLHKFRGAALRRLPKDAAHFVSVGCSGTWYFNWIEEMVTRMPKHTGVEFYSPKPHDLPDNVTWIANTAGDMRQIGDGVADILFSGQNIEHMWVEDVVGFLCESHRVVRDGGLLVMDSPNRRITALLGWSQPEHTVEFNHDEMAELLDLAGYEVLSNRGIWLCADLQDGTPMPFADTNGIGRWALARRIADAENNPASSFIWWIEARKLARAPQVDKLRQRVTEIFAIGWPERLNRMQSIVGHEIRRGGQKWFDSHGAGGVLMYGPYTAIRAGRYTVRLRLALPDLTVEAERVVASCDVVSGDGVLHTATEVRVAQLAGGREFDVCMDFDLPGTTFGLQFRVIAHAGIRLLAQKLADLTEHPDQVAAAA